MRYRKNIFTATMLSLLVSCAVAQNNTNSPYTRFGYGNLTEGAATEIAAMGGAGIANRTKQTINVLNPASHSGVDSLTFMFDVAAGTRMSRFSGASDRSTTFNANLDYLTMRFPLFKWLGFSAGMIPYSFVGYKFYQSDSIKISRLAAETPRTEYFTRSFNGNGGFSQVYGGLSAALFNHLAVGVNAYYMFGEVNNNRLLTFTESTIPSSVYANQIKISDMRFRFGLQLYHTFADKHDVTLGLIYEHKTKMNGVFVAQLNGDTVSYKNGFELPQVLGLGLNYTLNKQLTIGIDYSQQRWKDVLFFNRTDSLVNRTKIAIGAEYTPNPSGRRYADRVRYRVGVNTSNQYYKVNTARQPNDLTFTFGVGLPTRSGRSWLNATVEYGRIGSSTLLREDYLKITFSTLIDENWFFKPKL